MTTSAAEKVPGVPAEKEKVEKRRALGRGLDSLLPGPRAVVPGQSGGSGGREQVPHRAVGPVRNDKDLGREPAAVAAASSNSASTSVDPMGVATLSTAAAPAALPRAGVPALHNPPPLHNPSAHREPAAHEAEFTDEDGPITIQAVAETRIPANLVVNIELDSIDNNPYQTRYLFDREMLQELADSIKANGVVQPIVVRPAEEAGRYILVLGERRCRASKLAGMATIPAMVKRISEQQAAEMTVIENLQRQDLNCLEQAEAFRVLSQEFKLTQQQIGDRVGLSRESVSNYMRLLKLKKETMEYLTSGDLSFSDARMLLALESAEVIARAADEVVKKHLSGEQIEDLVMHLRGLTLPSPGQVKKPGGPRWVDPNVRDAQREMERLLGVRVKIRDKKGKGKIVIEYATVDDYERVVGMLTRK